MTPLEIALNTEQEGKELYTRAHANAGNSLAREIFAFLIREESRHYEIILEYADKLKVEGRMPEAPLAFGDIQGLKTIFSDALAEVGQALPEDSDDMAAIERAMEFEKNGVQYYEKFSADAQDENEKAFFSRLANEEQGHYMVLLDAFEALKDPKAWQEKASKIGLDGA